MSKYDTYNYLKMTDLHKTSVISRSSTVLFDSEFLWHFCMPFYHGTRRLFIHGKDLEAKIGRRLVDTDIPYIVVFLERNKDIVSIHLPYNNISSNGFKTLLDHCIIYDNVLVLDLQNNEITWRGTKYLKDDIEIKLKLRHLRLNGNDLGDQGLQDLAIYLLKNPYLLHLDAAEVGQSASSLVYLLTVLRNDQEVYNKNLKTLDISRPSAGCVMYFDGEHFATVIGDMLKRNKSLLELHVQKYGFSCHDIEIMMIGVKYNNTLQLLDLAANNIGDHGVKQIADWLVTRPSLKGLMLNRNIITNHGAKALSFGVLLSRIILLDVAFNKITDDGIISILRSVKKSPLIKYLRIFGNCTGHKTAELVNHMLFAMVLTQEHLDVLPYKVDDIWHLAQYPADRYKQRYYDTSSNTRLLPKLRLSDYCTKYPIRKSYFKYVDVDVLECYAAQDPPSACICNSCTQSKSWAKLCTCRMSDIPEIRKAHLYYSESTINSDFDIPHPEDCQCCFCYGCEDSKKRHLLPDKDECKCCECKFASDSDISITSVPSTELKMKDLLNDREKVARILKHFSCRTRHKILRWINIDENTFEEDLKRIGLTGSDTSGSEIADVENEPSEDWLLLQTTMSALLSVLRNDYIGIHATFD